MKKGNRLQAVVYSLLFFLLLPVACQLSPVYAVDSTPSADIKIRLEELKKEIASKAAKLKQEVNRQLQNKAYIGTVKSKNQNSATLATRTGAKIVSLNQDTIFESNVKTKKKFSQKTLIEEDYIAALGDVDEIGVLTAKKIILLPQPKAGQPLAEKTYFWGQIISISDKLITLKDRNFKNVAVSLTSADTSSDLRIKDFVIVTGIFGKNEIFAASFIYVIPQGGILKPKKIASPSAQPKSKQ